MTIDLEEREATLLMSIVNQYICHSNKRDTPMETAIMEKIINARNGAITKQHPQI